MTKILITLWRTIVPLAIVAAAVSAFIYLEATRPVAKLEPPDERTWPVTSRSVVHSDEQPVISAFGQIVAGRLVELRPGVPGEIARVSPAFRDGGVVEAGQTLIEIEDFDYRLAVIERTADLSEAEARLEELQSELSIERKLRDTAVKQLELRRQDLERYRALLEKGSATARAVEESEMAELAQQRERLAREQTIARLEARIRQQDAAVERAEAALEMARRDLADTELVAPITGFLTETRAAIGQQLSAGDRIGNLVAADSLEVRFQLRDHDYAKLLAAELEEGGGLIGRPIRVDWRIGGDVFTYDATIERTGGAIDPASGGVDIFARLDASGTHLPLRPGAFVEVRVPGLLYRDVVRLPETALTAGAQVYLIEDSRLRAVEVDVLGRYRDELLVRGDLPEGGQVVTTRFPEIGPGAKVVPR